MGSLERLETFPGLFGTPVEVWKTRVDVSDRDLDVASALLSRTELERAARYLSEADRRRFVVARSALRTLLGYRLNEAPEGLRFISSSHGKPALADMPDLSFSVSHSEDIALIALTDRGCIGVDVEFARPLTDITALSEICFSEPERALLARVPDEQRTSAFFRGWTQKEAYVKALGSGLSTSLQDFGVAIDSDPAAPMGVTHRRSGDVYVWAMHRLEPGAGYVGALACAVDVGRGAGNRKQRS